MTELQAQINLLRWDFEQFKRDVKLQQVLDEAHMAYWKAEMHAVECLLTELRTCPEKLPARVQRAVDVVMAITAPMCRPDDHRGMVA